MDEIDKQILEMLRDNSRMPFTDIAKRLKLTEGAVRYRVNSLAKARIIKRFTIEAGEEGLPSLIGVKVGPKVDMQHIASRIVRMDGVEKVLEITGETDMIVFARTSSSNTLNKMIDAIRAIPGVGSTVSYLVLQEHDK